MNAAPVRFRIRPVSGWATLRPREIWEFRDVLWMLALRDIKLRYRQTALGVVWVILQPLAGGLIFTLIFGRFARLPSEGQPYMLFVYCGLIGWNLFAGIVQRAGNSLVAESRLITKVYFPRIIIPLSAATSALVDFVVSCSVMLGLLIFYKVTPSAYLALLPLLLLIEIMLSVGFSLWIAALNVRYRDFAYALPFILQIWMYASPVVYGMGLVPDTWRIWFQLNPMCVVLEGFRAAFLGAGHLTSPVILAGLLGSAVMFLSGALFFRRVEQELVEYL